MSTRSVISLSTLLQGLVGLAAATAAMLVVVRDAPAQMYEPTWESLDRRPVPAWYADAKFGIFIHWGPYSVPAWAPAGTYSEWYQYWLQNKTCFGNSHPKPTAVYDYHVKTYGEDFSYYRFGELFKAQDFDPEAWAKLFEQSGAKYIVLTSKHHDGFCLWPNQHANKAYGRPWNSQDAGPRRDLIGELKQAVEKTPVKFGLYYSLYEWFNPLWEDPTKRERFVDEHFLPQIKELVTRYQPAILWADGDWEAPRHLLENSRVSRPGSTTSRRSARRRWSTIAGGRNAALSTVASHHRIRLRNQLRQAVGRMPRHRRFVRLQPQRRRAGLQYGTGADPDC